MSGATLERPTRDRLWVFLIDMYSREREIKADETYELPLCYVFYRMVQAAELQNAWISIYKNR